jgi:probable HAF family extracellular repeat protein
MRGKATKVILSSLALAVSLVGFVPANSASAVEASFQGLGQMPADYGGGTYVNGLSGDGSTVVGHAWTSGTTTRPFRWTAAGGYQDLGNLGADSSNGRAYDASFDGSVVVGQSATTSGLSAFRWQGSGGMQPLPIYEALATSDDGSVAVGMDIRWTAPGQVDHLGFLGGNNYTSAYGVSADGQTVAGFSETSPNRYAHAFRWTPAGGIQDLGVTNGTESLAWGVSPDGNVIFGEARDQAGFWRAFRWTSALGMRDMGTLGGPMSTAHAASADGSSASPRLIDHGDAWP